MGFKDILNKLGLSDLLNLIKIVVDNSKHYEIKDSILFIESTSGNRNEYTLPNTVEYDDVRKFIDKLYKKGVSGFVRKDLALPEIGMFASREMHRDIFERYKNRIKSIHYRILVASYTVMEFEDKGDYVTSNDLFVKMLKRYGGDARHIYNFCRSGLMSGFFWNELGDIIYQGADEHRIYEKFSKIFDEYVKFYPYAIWVSPPMNFDDIVDEMRIRLNINSVQRIDIYFRGKEKMNLCDDTITLLDQKEALKIETVARYTICHSPCVRISVAKISDKFKTF